MVVHGNALLSEQQPSSSDKQNLSSEKPASELLLRVNALSGFWFRDGDLKDSPDRLCTITHR
jgi:hypothetical protein